MTTTLPIVRAAAMAPFLVWLRDFGHPLERMLNDAGLPSTLIDDRDRPIPLRAGIRFVIDLARREGHDLPCRVAAHAGIEELGILGRIVMSSRTPREAYGKVARAYFHHGSHELFTISRGTGHSVVRHAFRIPTDDETLFILHQYVVALVRTVALRTGWAGPLIQQVELTPHPRHGLAGMSDHLGCEVVPARGRTAAVTFADALLDRPYVQGRAIPEMTIPEGCAVIRGDGTLAGSIATILPVLLDGGREPSLPVIADLSYMSARTLQRRLAAEATSLSALMDKVRAEQAIARLKTSAGPIRSIAAEMGYGSNASFTRAIRRWTATSPSRLRKTALGAKDAE